MLFVCSFLAVLAVDGLLIAYLLRDSRRRDSSSGVVDRVRAALGVVVHPSSDGGEPIEYPFHPEFAETDVRATLAEIEEL